jgi:hypothetical protein
MMTVDAVKDQMLKTVDESISVLAAARGKLTKDKVKYQCGKLSRELADILVSYGVSDVMVVTSIADIYPCKSHVWIEIGDTIVDVTAHQFECFDTIYIGAKSRWYQDWPDQVSKPANELLPSRSKDADSAEAPKG